MTRRPRRPVHRRNNTLPAIPQRTFFHRIAAATAALSVIAGGSLLAGIGISSASVHSQRPATAPSVLIGSSFGGSSVASIQATAAQFPTATVGRYYFPADPAPFARSHLAAIPAGETIFVSFKSSIAAVKSGAYDATFKTILASWNASGRTIYWTWQHEADNPAKGIAPADYVAGWNHLLADERALPSPRVHSMSVLMAYALSPRMPHGDPAAWYVDTDVIGFDSYQLKTELLAEQYAMAHGKALAFPEFGDGVVAGQSDAQALAFARQFIAQLTPNVFGAAWFNSGVNSFAGRPMTLAYLRSAA